MGAVEDGDGGEFDALVAELEDALGDEGGLLGLISCDDVGGDGAGRIGGEELFGELGRVVADADVGEREELGRGAVVLLKVVGDGFRVARREVEDVGDVGAAEGVDGLAVVADDHDGAVSCGHEVDDFALDGVGVLELIDEEVVEAALECLADVVVFAEEAAPEDEEVVEVGDAGLELSALVERDTVADLCCERGEGGGALENEGFEVAACVDGCGEEVAEGRGFGEAGIRWLGDVCGAALHEAFGIFAVERGEVGRQSKAVGVLLDEPSADGVKGAAGDSVAGAAEEVGEPSRHLSGGFVGEGEREDAFGAHAGLNEVGDAVGEGACFAGARPGDNEGRLKRGGDDGALLVVEPVEVGGCRRRSGRLHSIGLAHRDGPAAPERAWAIDPRRLL